MLAAGDIGVCQFIDHCYEGLSRQNCVDIHLFEQRAFVIDFAARDCFELACEFGDAFAAMRFHYADHYIFAATVAPDCFAQHVVALAYSRRVAQEKLEDTFALFRGGNFGEALFGGLGHATILRQRRLESYARIFGVRQRISPRHAFAWFGGRVNLAVRLTAFYRPRLNNPTWQVHTVRGCILNFGSFGSFGSPQPGWLCHETRH